LGVTSLKEKGINGIDMLTTLPELQFPVTRKQSAPLLQAVVQLNTIYAGMDERTQKAIGILLKTLELLADTDRKTDYTDPVGQARLFQDSEALVGDGTGLSTRIGDLRAAGLAIDFHNVFAKFKKKGWPLTCEPGELRRLAIKYAQLSPRKLDEIGLMLSYLRKDTSLIQEATFGMQGDE
jgi:hypothetical protein